MPEPPSPPSRRPRGGSASGGPVVSGARGSYTGAYLVGGVLVALLLLRFGFAS